MDVLDAIDVAGDTLSASARPSAAEGVGGGDQVGHWRFGRLVVVVGANGIADELVLTTPASYFSAQDCVGTLTLVG